MSQQLANSYNMDIGPTCPITLNPLKSGETRVLKCGHTFSEKAIKDWIEAERKKNHRTFTCPSCRVSYSIPNSEEEFNNIIPKNFAMDECIDVLELLERETTSAIEEERRLREEDNTLAKEKLEQVELSFLKIERKLNENEKNQREKQRLNEKLQLNAALNISFQQQKTETSIKILENHIELLKQKEMKNINILEPKPSAPPMEKKQPTLKHNVPVFNPEKERRRFIESARQRLEKQKKEVKELKEQIKTKKAQRLKKISICLVNKIKEVPGECKNCIKLCLQIFKWIIVFALTFVLYYIVMHLIPFLLLTLFLHPFLLTTKEISMLNKNDLFVIDTMKQLVNNNTQIMPPPFDSYQNLPLSYESRVAIAWLPGAIIMILLILNESEENLEISKKIYGTRKYFLHLTYLYRIQSFINWNNTEELQESILAKNLAWYGRYIGKQRKEQVFEMLTNDSPRRMCFPVYSWTWNYKPILTNIYIIFYYSQQLFLFIGQMYYNKRILLNYYPDLHPIVNIIIYIFSIQNLILISFLISPKFFKYKWCCREFKKKTLTNKEELKFHKYNYSEYEQIVDLKIESLEIREKNALYMLVDHLNVRYDTKSNLCHSRVCILFTIVGTIIFSIGCIYIIYILKAHYSYSIFQITNNKAYIRSKDEEGIIYYLITYGPITCILSFFSAAQN